eukprot:scaffold4029_cov117-Isochrysis_galbana.AAC.8
MIAIVARLVSSQPHSRAFAGSIPSRQSGMVQPAVEEMLATVHAAGSSFVSSLRPPTIARALYGRGSDAMMGCPYNPCIESLYF